MTMQSGSDWLAPLRVVVFAAPRVEESGQRAHNGGVLDRDGRAFCSAILLWIDS